MSKTPEGFVRVVFGLKPHGDGFKLYHTKHLHYMIRFISRASIEDVRIYSVQNFLDAVSAVDDGPIRMLYEAFGETWDADEYRNTPWLSVVTVVRDKTGEWYVVHCGDANRLRG